MTKTNIHEQRRRFLKSLGALTVASALPAWSSARPAPWPTWHSLEAAGGDGGRFAVANLRASPMAWLPSSSQDDAVREADAVFFVSDRPQQAMIYDYAAATRAANEDVLTAVLHTDARTASIVMADMVELFGDSAPFGFDFEDLRAILTSGHSVVPVAVAGTCTCTCSVTDGIETAVNEALARVEFPLGQQLRKATGALLIVAARPENLRLEHMRLAGKTLGRQMSSNACWAYSAIYDEALQSDVRVSVIVV
jgi:hypothetical protein